jgi:twitching motility protein PilT
MRRQEIDFMLGKLIDTGENISDVNITVGRPFQVEISGQLTEVEIDPPIGKLTPFQTEIIALNLINQDRRLTELLLEKGSCDCSYELPGKARFRVNIFSQRGNYSIVLRKLEAYIPSLEELKLPAAFNDMAEEKNGIIIVTGATGTGKSTSLAALLNEINEKKSIHIVTLEDPIEFAHPHKKATFNQPSPPASSPAGDRGFIQASRAQGIGAREKYRA